MDVDNCASSRDFFLAVEPIANLQRLRWARLLAISGKEAWINCMLCVHASMLASIDLLEEASFLNIEYDDARLSLSRWCRQHYLEELEHPDWLMEDLLESGLIDNKIKTSLPLSVQPLFEQITSLIRLGYPEAILGYLGVTECRPASVDALKRLSHTLNIPIRAFQTAIYHAEVDNQHREEIKLLIGKFYKNETSKNVMLSVGIETLIQWTKYFLDEESKKYNSTSSDSSHIVIDFLEGLERVPIK